MARSPPGTEIKTFGLQSILSVKIKRRKIRIRRLNVEVYDPFRKIEILATMLRYYDRRFSWQDRWEKRLRSPSRRLKFYRPGLKAPTVRIERNYTAAPARAVLSIVGHRSLTDNKPLRRKKKT
jgi:hypothetical protein